MKRFLLITLGFLALVSCNNKGQENNTDTTAENQIDLIDWYNNVFSDAADDTTTTIPDYVFSTDWMQRYIQYIDENLKGMDGLWNGTIDGESIDCRYWTMAYVDGDTIPEMLLWGGCWASQSLILTQYNNKVYASPRGVFSYIKGAGGLLHSQSHHSDNLWGAIYDMKNGIFTEKANYQCLTDNVDTSDVGRYGLTMDDIKQYYAGGEVGDSTVVLSKIELNGVRLGSCYGYGQFASCSGFDKMVQTLNFLYFSKGTSTRFPFTKVRTIDDLVMKKPLQ